MLPFFILLVARSSGAEHQVLYSFRHFCVYLAVLTMLAAMLLIGDINALAGAVTAIIFSATALANTKLAFTGIVAVCVIIELH